MKKFLSLVLIASTISIIGTSSFAETSEVSITAKDSESKAVLKPTKSRSSTFEVIGNNVRIRRTPGLQGQALGQLHTGDLVTAGSPSFDDIRNIDGYNWINVYSHKHSSWGWIALDYVVEVG